MWLRMLNSRNRNKSTKIFFLLVAKKLNCTTNIVVEAVIHFLLGVNVYPKNT